MGEQKENLIVSGNLWKQLILFSLPLLATNLLQQLYNAVDSVIVGRYVGGGALAAVGSTASIVFLIIGFFQGIATGAGVIISNYIGSDHQEGVKSSIGNAMVISFIGGIVIAAVAFFLSPSILRWILTPEDIFDMTNVYLQIYFLSIPFIAIYNTGAGISRALGDSRKPLYFLIVCSAANLFLDLLFVRVLEMGVAGVAWATLFSQLLSVFMVLLVFFKFNYPFNLKYADFKVDFSIIEQIIRIGLPIAVQSSTVSLANVLFQSQVNIFGSVAVAGYSAGSRIQAFTYMPITALAMATTTFVGQNYGAGNYERVKQIGRACIILGISTTLFSSILAYGFKYHLLSIFTSDPDVMVYGALQLGIIGIPTFLWAFPHIYGAVITGTGRSFGPMVITMVNMCGVRLAWIFIMLQFWYDIRVVYLSFPISWIIASISMILYYKIVSKKIYQMPTTQGR